MIEHIKGVLVSKHPTHIVLEANGIGYGISIPLSTYTKLEAVGSSLRLFTWLHVREDILQLFGFASEEEREVFSLLINVSGVGPRMALAVLSAMPVCDFLEAVRNENLNALVSIPGIGRKKAERLLLELKDKIEPAAPETMDDSPGHSPPGAASEAVMALVSLGCKYPEASGAVRRARAKLDDNAALEEIIREALKHI